MSHQHAETGKLPTLSTPMIVAWAVAAVVFVLTYWDRIIWVVGYASSPDYQYCFFVPAFAVFLLWYRRDLLQGEYPNGFSYWSIPCFAVWGLMRVAHAAFDSETLDGYSILPFLAGVTLALGGWRGFRWAWPSLLFMLFLLPLPSMLNNALRGPLQALATKASVFLIQTIGIPSYNLGNAIYLTEPPPLEVANVCSGLRMLMVFVTLCVGTAFVLRGPMWEKIVIVASAIPIAILANVARITATGVQREYFNTEELNHSFHDMAGFAMPVLAFLLAWGEIALIRRLFPEDRLESPVGMQLADDEPKRTRRVGAPRI